MSESKDMLTELQEEALLRYGTELTPAQVAYQMSLHPFNARIDLIKRIRTPETFASPLDAGKRHALERAVRSTHEKLRRSGR